MSAPLGWQTARRVPGFEAVFSQYLRWLVRRSFSTVWVHRDAAPFPSSGYVAAANHSSWWDGFIPYLLHRKSLPHAPFALMMSDEELRRFPFFRWGGAFSVDATSARRSLPAIRYAASEARNGAGVWMFPRGRFEQSVAPAAWTSGFLHAARTAAVPIVPVAMRFRMTEKQRPDAFVDIAPAVEAFSRNARAATARVVAERLQRIDDIVAYDGAHDEFLPFLGGARGVDGHVASLIRPLRRWF